MSLYEVAGYLFYGFKIHQERKELICELLKDNDYNDYSIFENILIKNNDLEKSPKSPDPWNEFSKKIQEKWFEDYAKWKKIYKEKVFDCEILKAGTDDVDDITYYLVITESKNVTCAEYNAADDKEFDELPLTNSKWKQQLKNCCEKFGIKFGDPKWIMTLKG